MDELTPNTSQQIWLISFVDLISLLLVFFVLMISMSEFPLTDWEKFYTSLPQKHITSPKVTAFEDYSGTIDVKITPQPRTSLNYSYLEALPNFQKLQTHFTIVPQEWGIKLFTPEFIAIEAINAPEHIKPVLDFLYIIKSPVDIVLHAPESVSWDHLSASLTKISALAKNMGYNLPLRTLGYKERRNNFIIEFRVYVQNAT